MIAALGTLALNLVAPIIATVAADQISKAMQPDQPDNPADQNLNQVASKPDAGLDEAASAAINQTGSKLA